MQYPPFSRGIEHDGRQMNFSLGVMDGRRRGPAGEITLRQVNLQVRTRPGAPANFRLCANFCREHV